MSVLPFDDRDGVIWYNGKLTQWRDARVHVLCHSLHYGNAVFEGARVPAANVVVELRSLRDAMSGTC